jgi:ribose transport system ATP-binding protein
VTLQVQNLFVRNTLHDLSFEVRQGEILGIFGLMGAGQAELARALLGLLPISAGKITMEGKEVHIRRPADAIKHRIGLLPRDRRESLVPRLPIAPNITLADIGQFPLYQVISHQKEARAAEEYVQELRITPPLLDRPVMFLSGGNQQKVVLARWLFSQARILIFDEPTRGIDVGAKAEVFTLMNQLVRRGVGILMISSEMPEIIRMADRILVMRGGCFTAEYQAGSVTQEQLLHSAS